MTKTSATTTTTTTTNSNHDWCAVGSLVGHPPLQKGQKPPGTEEGCDQNEKGRKRIGEHGISIFWPIPSVTTLKHGLKNNDTLTF